MVDKIRMTNVCCIHFKQFENNRFLKEKSRNEFRTIYRLSSPRSLKNDCFLTVSKYDDKITVEGSIRKWYFGVNGVQDLSQTQFIEAMQKISFILFNKHNALFDFEIKNLEVGCNVKLPRKYKEASQYFRAYKTFKKITYGNESTKFDSTTYSLIVYNKLAEMINSAKKKGNERNPKPLVKIAKFLCFQRFEMSIKKMTKAPTNKLNINTVQGLIENWDKTLEEFEKKITEIVTLKTSNNVAPPLAQFHNITQLKNFLIIQVINLIGAEIVFLWINNLNRDKKTARIWLENIYKSCQSMSDKNYEFFLKEQFHKRVDSLKSYNKREKDRK
jgi:hypothetical protein